MSNPSSAPSSAPPPPGDSAAGHWRRVPLFAANPISYWGWIVTLISFITVCVLIAADFFWFREQVYNSIVTYLVVPAFLILGLLLTAFGYFLHWYRSVRSGGAVDQHYPIVDLNVPQNRKGLVLAALVVTVFVAFSAVGGYKAYHVTESNAFCGTVCHRVMEPEYTAYLASPHARVHCVECHIGSGATWYVRSKMSGMRQVFAYVGNTYELPIKVPVDNLRPAQETCEQCHWPEKFSGSFERVFRYVRPDEENTPFSFHLLMKVGGGSAQLGTIGGIHWHTSRLHRVEYWATDRQRQEIPWVRVSHVDGTAEVYRTEDAPASPPADEIRTMDCIDCHNRPSHIYRPPEQVLSEAFAFGLLDRRIPSLYETCRDLLAEDYPTKDTGLAKIEEGLRTAYADRIGAASLEKVAEVVRSIYATYVFPEQGVDWRTYPNNLGHMRFLGCARCHDDRHQADTGKVIRRDCNLCHDIVAQLEGEACFEPVVYGVEDFRHPGGEGAEEYLCAECHAAPEPMAVQRVEGPRAASRHSSGNAAVDQGIITSRS